MPNLILPIMAVLWSIAAACMFTQARRTRAAQERKRTAPSGPHMPTSNPYRIGAAVWVAEDPDRIDMAFNGTVLSCAGGMVTVRERQAPYASVTVAREYVYPEGTVL